MVLWRNKSFLHFNTNARFPPVYYMLGANLGLLLNGDVSVMTEKAKYIFQNKIHFFFVTQNEIKLNMPPIIAK